MDSIALYPLSFTPIFRPVLWGGTRLMGYKLRQQRSTHRRELGDITP
ncbi:hypothetical protein [Porphyromonas gingivicanis]|nr:hypothetical protein [Porphyromonas gingivicanis]